MNPRPYAIMLFVDKVRTQDAFAEDLLAELLAHCTATQATGTLDGLHIDGGQIDVRAVAQQLCERYNIRRRPA